MGFTIEVRVMETENDRCFLVNSNLPDYFLRDLRKELSNEEIIFAPDYKSAVYKELDKFCAQLTKVELASNFVFSDALLKKHPSIQIGNFELYPYEKEIIESKWKGIFGEEVEKKYLIQSWYNEGVFLPHYSKHILLKKIYRKTFEKKMRDTFKEKEGNPAEFFYVNNYEFLCKFTLLENKHKRVKMALALKGKTVLLAINLKS